MLFSLHLHKVAVLFTSVGFIPVCYILNKQCSFIFNPLAIVFFAKGRERERGRGKREREGERERERGRQGFGWGERERVGGGGGREMEGAVGQSKCKRVNPHLGEVF